ncbi:MAG TPA: acyl-CoA dehydrogenase [Polyangiaceae bacterium]|nr:acyl-CoA dehydrogenase [Polyangiaceae bacterium]
MSSDDSRLPQSYVRSLLSGRVDASALSPFPNLSQGRAEQMSDLISKIRRAHHTPEMKAVDRLRDWELLGDTALWSPAMWCRVVRQLGTEDVCAALSATVHSALGLRLLQTWGREDQLRQVQDDPASLCAFSLTEESPGSDVGRLMTYAEAVSDGYVLNGVKHWVTNAEAASHFIVVARTAAPIAADKPKLTAFLVPRGPGIILEPAPTDVLPRAGVARLRLDNVALRRSQILGGEGKGFRVVMSGLSDARLLVSAAIVGSCVAAFNSVISRLQERRAFGRPVGKFPSVQFGIAGMQSDILAMESFVHGVAGAADATATVDPVERGVVRLAVSRGSQRVLETARELYGAAAFRGRSSIAQRWADTRALTLLDGSDSALESYIILEGTRDVRHRFLQMLDATDPLARVDAAASFVVDKVGARLQRARAESLPELRVDRLHQYTAQLSRKLDAAIVKYRGDVVEKQHVHRRLAQLLAELATWVALIARVESEVQRAGKVGATRMIDVAAVWVAAAQGRIEQTLAALDHNDDKLRDEVAVRAYGDKAYPFEVF